MLPKRVALIDKTGAIDHAELSAVAAALGVQVARDLSRFWPVSATVQTLPADAGVPPGVWPVFIMPNLPDGEGGFHLTKTSQPYAKVAGGDGWTVAASHELLEMLVDPSGNMTHAAPAIDVTADGKVQDAAGVFEYLVEVSDPSESPEHGYQIDGIAVSDFYTPRYFDALPGAGVQYSFTGALTAPRQVLKWGYLSWHDPLTGQWMQLDYVTEDPPKIKPMIQVADATSIRGCSDASMQTRAPLAKQMQRHGLPNQAAAHRSHLTRAAKARANLYQT